MQKTTIYRKPMGENLFEEEFTNAALSQMGNSPNSLFELAFSTWEFEKSKIHRLIFADSSALMATTDAPLLWHIRCF